MPTVTRSIVTRAIAIASLVTAAACTPPAIDDDGFTTDVGQAIATRGHDFGCFTDNASYTLQLAVDGEGEEAERLAALIQDGPENFVTGTWDYEVDLFGEEQLSVAVGDLAFVSTALDKKFGTLVSFPAGDATCGLRGFLAHGSETLNGTYLCEDEFWDTVRFDFGDDGSVEVHAERDDEGSLTEDTDFGAYFIEAGELFVLRPGRDEPELRFMRGTPGAESIDLGGGACALQP
jgi:hypothetical protein